MKKIILSAIMLIGLAFSTKAQDISNNALGLRLGNNSGFGVEVSYQKELSKNNRLELDLGWRNSNDVDAIKLAGLYQWIWNIDGDFNWFAGAGGGLGSYSSKINGIPKSGVFLFIAGDIGIEYEFREIPLLISLDLRPEIGGSNYYTNNFGSDMALGLRYKF